MPASYSTSHQTGAGTNLTMIHIGEHATQRARLHQIVIGSDATPADVATEFAVLRSTAAPTGGTTLTPVATDGPAFTAAGSTVKGGTMTEPTYNAVATLGLMNFALNQRATLIWNANPGREFVVTAGTANGIGLRSIASGGTPNINCTIAFDE